MGNYKFRLANMMPIAWFNKLKDMSPKETAKNNKRRSQFSSSNATTQSIAPNSYLNSLQTPRVQPNRASYYYSSSENKLCNPKSSDTHFPLEKPRKSKKKSRRKAAKSPKLLASSVSSGCSYRVSKASDFSSELTADSSTPSLMSTCEFYFDNNLTELSMSCICKAKYFESTKKVFNDKENKDFDEFSDIELPPILTKSVKKEVLDDDNKVYQVRSNSYDTVSSVKEKNKKILQMKKSTSPGLHRLRMRANSPRIASRKVQAYVGRKNTALQQQLQLRNGLSDSLAIVKSSADPQKDFRDSMMEMIVENNIRKSKDLEELLACYLSLNSNEYHGVIVKVFEQIWFDLTNIKL